MFSCKVPALHHTTDTALPVAVAGLSLTALPTLPWAGSARATACSFLPYANHAFNSIFADSDNVSFRSECDRLN